MRRAFRRAAGLGCGGAILFGFLLRAFLSFRAPSSVDLDAYGQVADALEAGKRLYEATDRYNYPPVWAWVILVVERFSGAVSLPFVGTMRSFLTVVDLASAALLWRIARHRGNSGARAAAFFLLNPVSIWVTSVQGQFDNVSLLFLLAAIAASRTMASVRTSKAAVPLPPLLLSASVAFKQVTVLHPLLFLRRFGALAVLPYGVTAILFLPYAGQWKAIRDHVLLYRSLPRSYGFSEWVIFDARFAFPVAGLAVASGIAAVFLLRHDEDLVRTSLILFLVLLFFAPGFGFQYLVWPLTLGALTGGAGYLLCTLFSTLWILGSHFAVPGSGQWFGQLVWLSIAFWGSREIRAARDRARVPGGSPA